MNSIIDIIIPVYKGYQATRRCLNSVLRNPQARAHEVVVVNDASPDGDITEYLRELQQGGQITLVEHSDNQGFVASANEALLLHPDRDVVLLNSDTEVAGDWLDRLAQSADANAQIGTVTPFSNNATICSYPRFCTANRQPADLTVAQLDEIFRDQGSHLVFELPTGVGFCIYIRRACIDAVGCFDAEGFGLGYGEEVDFCMRASELGFKHLLCGSTYVYHEGSVSFGDARHERTKQAQRIINRLYPDYPKMVWQHIQEDPARDLRRAVDIERLRRSNKPRVLFVSHSWGGGIQRHIDDLSLLLDSDANLLVLRPYSDSVHTLSWGNPGEEFEIYLDLNTDYPWIVEWLQEIGISRVHYHHVQGFPPTVLTLAGDLRAPYWCTLHDYFPVCPQYNLASAEGRYCGEPDPAGCNRCLEARPAQWPWDIRQWRKTFSGFLGAAERVIVPTRDVKARLGSYFSQFEPVVLSHPEPDGAIGKECIDFRPQYRKIAVVGHISAQKGLGIVSDCAKDARRKRLPLFFRIIGTLGSADSIDPEDPLSITGQYDDKDLDRLILQERPDAFFFASEVPETYSYTLSAAMRTGLAVIAIDRGAFPERLAAYPNAHLKPAGTSAAEWNQLFLLTPSAYTLTSDSRRAGNASSPCPPDEYAALYRDALVLRGPSERISEIRPTLFRFPEERRRPAPGLRRLVTDALDLGLRESADQLRRSVEEAVEMLDWQARVVQERGEAIEDLKQQLRVRAEQYAARTTEIDQLKQTLTQFKEANKRFELAHEQHVAHLDQTIDGLRTRIAELEGSSFWKLTYPLRVLVHTVKSSGRRFKGSADSLPRRLGKAIDTLRRQGPVGLIREARQHLAGFGQSVNAKEVTATAPSYEKTIHPLRMPRSSTPLVSIIIPTYGQHGTTFACLGSIADHTNGIDVEVIVVDDCYAEPAQTALSPVENLEILRNDKNLGFLRSCNRGVEFARGEYLVLLNNDTIVRGNWLKHLLTVFERFSNVGAVGAKLLFPDGTLQEAGGIVWRDASAWNYGRGRDASDPAYNYVRQVDYCSGACLLLPRQVFLDIGGFDERFAPAYYEDTDLCFAVRAKGMRVLYQPKAEIVHFEGVSHGTNEESGIKAYQTRNRDLFLEKWHIQLSGHMPNGVMPERERDRGVSSRILWIEACMLTPDEDSGSLRTARLLRILRSMGAKVTFAADSLEYRQPYTEQLQQEGIEVIYAPYTSSVEDYLSKNATLYDAVVLCRHYVAIKYLGLIRRIAPDVRVVFDTIDLHFLRLRRQASLDGRGKTKKLAKTAYQEEIHLIQNTDLTLVVSDVEKAILAQEVPTARVLVLSNVHDPAEKIAPLSARRDIMFVGGFQHPPNVDAVRYYADEIWPRVRSALPEVKTYIIGSKMTEDLARHGRAAGLEMVGYVPDLEPYLNGCRLSISPLRFGAGVKGKVNQSMSYGLPVVASPVSVEGMSLVHQENILVADTADEFAQAVIRLYTDDELWQRLSAAGLENIKVQFSSETARRALAEMLGLLDLPTRFALAQSA